MWEYIWWIYIENKNMVLYLVISENLAKKGKKIYILKENRVRLKIFCSTYNIYILHIILYRIRDINLCIYFYLNNESFFTHFIPVLIVF